MSNFESRYPERRQATNKAVVRVAFSPSEALGAAIKRFTLADHDHKPIPLRSSRRVELGFSGGDSDGPRYTPDDRRWLSETERRMKPMAGHHIRLASYVLQKELQEGALGLDFQLMPNPGEIQMLDMFARNARGEKSPYVDVHAIIPAHERVSKGLYLDAARHDLEQLLGVHHPALHRPGYGPGVVPSSQKVYVHSAQIMSRIPGLRVVR